MSVRDVFVAHRAQHVLLERRTAAVVDENGWWLEAGIPAVAPLHQRDERRRQVFPFGGEPIFTAHGAILVGHAFEEAMLHEASEAIGQQILGDAEVILELAETADAPE